MQNFDQMFARLQKERQEIIDRADRDARRSSMKMLALILVFSAMAGALINHWIYPVSEVIEKWRREAPANPQTPAVYNFMPVQYQLKQIDDRLSRIEAVVVGRPSKRENNQ